jgi:DNA-binding MarR family transcriptional regulator
MSQLLRAHVTLRDEAVEIQRLVFQAFAVLKKGADAWFREHGLTGAQVGVLTVLSGHEGKPMGAIGAELWCDVSNVTGLVARLEEQRLVVRSLDPSDQRVKRVRLTERGRAALAKTLPGHEAALVRHATVLSREERRTLIALLRKLIESNEQQEES